MSTGPLPPSKSWVTWERFVGTLGVLILLGVGWLVFLGMTNRPAAPPSQVGPSGPPAKVYSQQEAEVIRQLQDAETRNKIAVENQYGK